MPPKTAKHSPENLSDDEQGIADEETMCEEFEEDMDEAIEVLDEDEEQKTWDEDDEEEEEDYDDTLTDIQTTAPQPLRRLSQVKKVRIYDGSPLRSESDSDIL